MKNKVSQSKKNKRKKRAAKLAAKIKKQHDIFDPNSEIDIECILGIKKEIMFKL